MFQIVGAVARIQMLAIGELYTLFKVYLGARTVYHISLDFAAVALCSHYLLDRLIVVFVLASQHGCFWQKGVVLSTTSSPLTKLLG